MTRHAAADRVFTIAHHRLVDAWRRSPHRPPISDARPRSAAQDNHQVDSIDPALQAAIDTLTDDQHAIILLGFVADLSLEDVARITHRRVGRAVKALQRRLAAAEEHAWLPQPNRPR